MGMGSPAGFGVPSGSSGGGGGGWTPPAGAAGDLLAYNGTDWVALPQGETALTIGGGASTINMAAGRTFTGTLTGAVTFSVSNTWGNRSFVLILTNSGTVAEPAWPTASVRTGAAEWDTTDGVVNTVFFTWRSAGSLLYSVGQEP